MDAKAWPLMGSVTKPPIFHFEGSHRTSRVDASQSLRQACAKE
jgi:hypothetical protein